MHQLWIPIALVLCAGSFGSEVRRQKEGDLQLEYSKAFPSSLSWRGKPLISPFYFHATTVDPNGKTVEGFNFARDFEGLRQCGQKKVAGGTEVFWYNKKHVYFRKGGKTDQLAGEATVTLILTGEGVKARYVGEMPPHQGGGEFSFYLNEATVTGGGTCPYEAVVRGKTIKGTLPLPPSSHPQIWNGLTELRIDGPEAVFEFTFDTARCVPPRPMYFQDFRRNTAKPGTYRLVMSYPTKNGFKLDCTWSLKITPKSRGAAEPVPPKQQAKAGAVPPPDRLLRRPKDVEVDFGAPAEIAFKEYEGGAAFQAQLTPKGQITILEGDQPVTLSEANTIFAGTIPKVEDSQEAGMRRITRTYRGTAGEMVQEVTVWPDEVWMIWRLAAKSDVKGHLGVTHAPTAFGPPYIGYRSVNQQSFLEVDAAAAAQGYDIIAGGKDRPREVMTGSSSRDWLRSGLSHTIRPGVKAGERWTGVWRLTKNQSEPYPKTSFDGTLEERGICSPLLPDVAEDGFAIVPARDRRYTFPGKPMKLRLKYYSPRQVARVVDIRAKVLDMWEQEVGRGEWHLDSQGKRFAMLEIPVTTAVNGVYRIELEYLGKAIRTRELVFTVIPQIEETGYRPDSIFGASLGWGDFIWTLAQRIGLKFTRSHCGQGDTRAGKILPIKGTPQWPMTDQGLAMRKTYRMAALSSLAEMGSPYLIDLWKQGDFAKYKEAFVNEYVVPTVTRYKGQVEAWEITNEPYGQYNLCPEKWVELLKACHAKIKEIDPEAKVVGTCGPPGSMGYDWYHRTFELGSLDYQDAVSCHLYMFGPMLGGGQAMRCREYMLEIRRAMRKHGKELPLINSETTVTSLPTLYRHPSHQRYIRMPKGAEPVDPVIAAQFYFKMLTVHLAERVPYSFHVFHGGIEYDSHTGEYDETPFSYLVAQATLAKHFEMAEYVGDVNWAPDIYAGLFRNGTQLILVPWGPKFLRNEWADVSIPLPAAQFKARDIFDNPLPVAGGDAQTRLSVTWEGFYLITDQLSTEELRTALEASKIEIHRDAAAGKVAKGQFQGKGAGPVGRGDWSGFMAVDLAQVVNRSFEDDKPADGKGGWTDEGRNDMRHLPPGEWLANGVPFKVIDAARNGGKGCLILSGGMHESSKALPAKASIAVGGKRLQKLHFLHTTTWGNGRGIGFKYVLTYSDGFVEEIPVVLRESIRDWWSADDLPKGKVAWIGPNEVREKVRVYQLEHQITHPKGAQAVLDTIEVVSEKVQAIPVVIAITGVLAN
jgi:hypothetical protein